MSGYTGADSVRPCVSRDSDLSAGLGPTTNLVADPSGRAAGRQPARCSVRAGAAAERLHPASVCPIGRPGGAKHAQSAPGGGRRGQLGQNAGHPSATQPGALTANQKHDVSRVVCLHSAHSASPSSDSVRRTSSRRS